MKQFLRQHGWVYLPGLLFLALSSWLQVMSPRILGQLIDDLNVPAENIDLQAITSQLLNLMLIAALAFITRFIWRSFIMGNSRHLENDLRRQLFQKLQSLPVQYYQHQKTGNLMVYAINDIGAIRQTLGPGLALSANAIVMGILSVGSMSGQINPRLTLFALLPVPVVIVMIIWMGRKVQQRFRMVQEAFAAVSDRVQESISGIQVIKAYGQEFEEVERFEQLNRRSRHATIHMTKVSATMSPLVSLLFGISFSISLIYGSRLVLDGSLTLGEFIAFNGYLALIVDPVQSIARIINLLQKGMASYKRYQTIMSASQIIEDAPGIKPVAEWPLFLPGTLCVRSLTFTYPEQRQPALTEIDLELSPGRMIGILGRTGSGKSTLAALLQRQYEIEPGMVTLNGQDILDIPLAVLRRQFAHAPQDNFIFSTTIAENISFFDNRFSREDIRQAAVFADLDETIMSFPDGYDTMVGERGVTLSGGQRQRVGLARALVRQAPFLILDDALSAVDTETEHRILQQLRNLLLKRTTACLVIANRISALQHCDEILVLVDGKVSERGSHDDLLALNGFYAEVTRRQSGREQDRQPSGKEDGNA